MKIEILTSTQRNIPGLKLGQDYRVPGWDHSYFSNCRCITFRLEAFNEHYQVYPLNCKKCGATFWAKNLKKGVGR